MPPPIHAAWPPAVVGAVLAGAGVGLAGVALLVEASGALPVLLLLMAVALGVGAGRSPRPTDAEIAAEVSELHHRALRLRSYYEGHRADPADG